MTSVDPMVVKKKLAIVVANLRALESVATLPADRYREDLFRRKGTERMLQELIEAAIDVNAHLLVQQGHPPPDDYYQGFLLLAEHHILSPELAAAIAPSAGTRQSPGSRI